MSKVWVFFKLRMLQLRYDKTALFFSYFLPVILLMGIGYPMEMADKAKVPLHYSDNANSQQSAALLSHLQQHPLLNLTVFDGSEGYQQALKSNQISHFLQLKAAGQNTGAAYELFAGGSNEQQMQSKAIAAIVADFVRNGSVDGTKVNSAVVSQTITPSSMTSYIVTLLPGLIGMTLLIVGLNGFGAVLITEAQAGLYKNIKTIDASPFAFLTGLLLSRLFVCYTVACLLYGIGVMMFDMTANIDFLLLFVVLSLGCLSFLGLGLVIAVLSPSVNAFNGIVNFVQLPFVIFSGVFFSTSAFPGWLQGVTEIIPLAQMVSGLKAIFFEQAGLSDVSQLIVPISVLSLWCLLTLFIGWKKFEW